MSFSNGFLIYLSGWQQHLIQTANSVECLIFANHICWIVNRLQYYKRCWKCLEKSHNSHLHGYGKDWKMLHPPISYPRTSIECLPNYGPPPPWLKYIIPIYDPYSPSNDSVLPTVHPFKWWLHTARCFAWYWLYRCRTFRKFPFK